METLPVNDPPVVGITPDILLALIAALEATLAFVITPSSIVKVAPELLTVISPLSPSLIPPPDILATELSSFFKNISPVSVLMAGSPTTRSLAPGSLPEPLFSLIVFDIG